MTADLVKNEVRPNAGIYYVSIVSVVIMWLFLVYKPLISAIFIWASNDIYNHCFIVIPASLFLIYEKRKHIDWEAASTSYLAVVAFLLQLLLYTLGTAADIQLFQHAAIFAMIPTMFWMFQGNRIAWQCKFPLLFMVFAIPVGEELIPVLQEITADMSVAMLEWSGIPLFRSGLFIEIPQGKFLVAEACSGVSFLIASIVLGNLYAYMNLVSLKRRLAFVLLSICFPIFANAIRVYGIILTGYLTDMEHAVGADHLIYGWFFFALVLVCLFLLGEVIKKYEQRALRKKPSHTPEIQQNTKAQTRFVGNQRVVNKALFGIVFVLLLTALFQNYKMLNVELKAQNTSAIELGDFDILSVSSLSQWHPRYVDNTSQNMYLLAKDNLQFNLFYAYYDGSGAELVSSSNRLYEQDRWTHKNRSRPIVGDKAINEDIVSSSNGNKRAIYYWYNVDGEIVNSFSRVKLKQLLQRLKGQQSEAAIVAVSFDIDTEDDAQNDKIIAIVNDILVSFTPISN